MLPGPGAGGGAASYTAADLQAFGGLAANLDLSLLEIAWEIAGENPGSAGCLCGKEGGGSRNEAWGRGARAAPGVGSRGCVGRGVDAVDVGRARPRSGGAVGVGLDRLVTW